MVERRDRRHLRNSNIVSDRLLLFSSTLAVNLFPTRDFCSRSGKFHGLQSGGLSFAAELLGRASVQRLLSASLVMILPPIDVTNVN